MKFTDAQKEAIGWLAVKLQLIACAASGNQLEIKDLIG